MEMEDVQLPFLRIGKKIGVSPETVRKNIEKRKKNEKLSAVQYQ